LHFYSLKDQTKETVVI